MADSRAQDYRSGRDRRGAQPARVDARRDGVGPVKTARDARQGYWDSPVVGILFTSLTLAFIAFLLLMIWLNL